MSELGAGVDAYVNDPPTCRSLRSEIKRWLAAWQLPPAWLPEALHTVNWLYQEDFEEDDEEPPTWLPEAPHTVNWLYQEDFEEDDDEELLVVMAVRYEWADLLREIKDAWLLQFARAYPHAHPAMQQGFSAALTDMIGSDFLLDLRHDVEVHIARHERRAVTNGQLELFPD